MDYNQFFAGATLTTLLGLFGGAVRWLWLQRKADKLDRESALEKREVGLMERQTALIEELEQKLSAFDARLTTLGETLSRQRRAIDLLVIEVSRLDPGSRLLDFIRHLLGEELLIPSKTTQLSFTDFGEDTNNEH